MSKELREKLVRVSREAYDRGFVSGIGGNISARISTSRVLIKPSGMRLKDLTPKDLLVVDLSGKVIEGTRKPSEEIRFHLGIYKLRKDVGAVIHTHSPAATAFAVVGRELPPITAQAAKILGKIPLVDYAPPGSKELAKLVVKAFKPEVKAVLLRGHGSVAVGKNLVEAFNNADLLEETARIALLTFQLGELKKIPKYHFKV